MLEAATSAGHRSLGFHDVGRIEVGAHADLVTLDLHSPRTAGTGATAETAVFAATAADVVQVIRDGQVVAENHDRHEVGHALESVIADLWEDV